MFPLNQYRKNKYYYFTLVNLLKDAIAVLLAQRSLMRGVRKVRQNLNPLTNFHSVKGINFPADPHLFKLVELVKRDMNYSYQKIFQHDTKIHSLEDVDVLTEKLMKTFAIFSQTII